jgi:uncharacterized membrane protein YbaN (DUF454 family)
MHAQIKRVLILLVGWGFILLGIVGLFLPVLQGILFLFVGLIILSSEYAWAHRVIEWLRRRFPRIGHVADQAGAKAASWLQRFSHRKPD